MKRTTMAPNSVVRGAQSGRRLSALLDLLGRRWSLRVLWELRKKKRKFRDLRTACDDVSPSVLNQRLSELRLAGVVAHDAEGYALTARGAVLLEVLAPLEGLANRWSIGATVPEKRARVVATKGARSSPALAPKGVRPAPALKGPRSSPALALKGPRPAPALALKRARPAPALTPAKPRPRVVLAPPGRSAAMRSGHRR